MSKLVRVNTDNFKFILELKGQLEKAKGEPQALNDAVTVLVQTFKARTADEKAFIVRNGRQV